MENEHGKWKMMEVGNSCRSEKSHKGSRKREKPGCSVKMESRIWENLPDDVLEGVIARLPIATFFRFRLVCRKWNSFLYSDGFLRRWADVGRSQPWFYNITDEYKNIGAMYDPVTKKWHRFTNTLLSGGFYPCASVGGLVCYLRRVPRSMYVCNPLTNIWKELPSKTVGPCVYAAMGMVLSQDSVSSGYRIVWVSYDGEYDVYDSLNNSWQINSGRIPANVQLPLNFNYREVTVSINTKVYFCRSNPHGIVSYDVVTREWEQLLIPPPQNSTDLALAECEGRILLMGQVKEDESTAVYVWELEWTMLTWVELDMMPTSWCLEFERKSMDLICLGNKGLLMMLLKWRYMNRVFTYDVARREWSKVPRCVLSGDTRRQLIDSGTVLFPCLITSP